VDLFLCGEPSFLDVGGCVLVWWKLFVGMHGLRHPAVRRSIYLNLLAGDRLGSG